MGRYETIIFDLDGTLLDTLEDLTDAVNYALEAYKMPLRTIEEVRNFVGNGVRNLMLQAVPDGEKNPRFEEVFALFKAYYGEHCNEKTGPYEGVLELMKELKKQGYVMGIVSNKIDSAVKDLNSMYFAEYIQVAIGEKEGVIISHSSKPGAARHCGVIRGAHHICVKESARHLTLKEYIVSAGWDYNLCAHLHSVVFFKTR